MIPFVAVGPGPDYPAVADVDIGVNYDFGNLTGTLSGGGSGDALEATSQEILALLQGVMNGDNSAVLAELDSAASAQLDGIEATVAALAVSLAGTHVTVNSRVSGSTITAYMADDFKVRSGTQLSITVDDSAAGLYDKLVAIGVANLAFGASRDDAEAGEITGTIASLAHATGVTTIVVEVTACGSALEPDRYTYQVQSSQTQGSDEDDYIELEGMLMLRQRTVAPRG